MNFLVDIIKGIFVGIANIIPGVSGGTMAVSFGIYDKILSSISNLFKDFKKSFKTLLPVAIGMVVGIIGFSFAIDWLLRNYPFATSAAFTGLILGGLPAILQSLKDGWNKDTKKSIIVNLFLFAVLASIVICMCFVNGDAESGILITVSGPMIIKLFFMGIIAAATMVIPGVSGSLVLMILGYYFGILTAVKDFISALKGLDFKELLNQALILAPFALGCFVGVIFISKLIEWLFNHYASATFSGILGLIIASPFSIFYKVQQEYDMSNLNVPMIIIGVVVCILCVILTLFIAKLEGKQNVEQE
ncbi:MAG: DUF368 domain-containing protein [Lachnospiraceae bacterium]|nr:DUF368 domain-containing protein [Lachnospiraceae bacterium]